MTRQGSERQNATISDRRNILLQLLWLWVLLVVLYFCWEVATYRGLYAMAAEWQFERLGQDLPTFTFSILTLLFTWPALLLVRLGSRRRRRQDDSETAEQTRDEALVTSIVESAEEFLHVLLGFGAALALAAIVALAWTLFLPKIGTPRPYAPYADSQPPREGATSFEGRLTYGRIASFGRGILFLRHTVLYAPLMPPPGGDPRVRYFVEFLPAERADIMSGGTLSHRAGILVRGDMPGALIRLYRYLGYRIAPHYNVLYASQWTLRWPYYMLAAQFAIAATGFLLVALWQKLHIRRLREDIAASQRRAAAALRRRAPEHAAG